MEEPDDFLFNNKELRFNKQKSPAEIISAGLYINY